MSADRSAGRRTAFVKARTLAHYHETNPTHREGGRISNIDSSIYTSRAAGGYAFTLATAKPREVDSNCGCSSGSSSSSSCPSNSDITGFSYNWVYDVSGSYNYRYDISWNPLPFPNTFTLGALGAGAQTFIATGPNSGILLTETFTYGSEGLIYVTIYLEGCPDITTGGDGPCFLAGSLVMLADGSSRPIEDIKVGDFVLGAFGEMNTVLALHRPLLGSFTLVRINDEHTTTSHHPHIGVNKAFYAADPAGLAQTYGKEHDVIDATGAVVKLMLHGLKEGRVQQMVVGVELQTSGGAKVVSNIDPVVMPPETQLYNLVINGSHTYHVDGYAVTGWPREDDFDYDAWVLKLIPS